MANPVYAVTAVMLLLVGGCAGGESLEWKEFASPDGRFTVLMPKNPKIETRSQGPIHLTAYAAEVKNGAYMVSHNALPPGTPFDFPAALQGVAAKYQGKILSESDLPVKDGRGKAFEMSINQPKGFISSHIIVVQDQLYQVMALGTNARMSDPDVQKFLNSFKMKK